MSLESMLNQTVTISRQTATNDGAGAVTIATVETVITRAAVWQGNARLPLASDRLTPESTHVMVLVPGDYAWSFPADRFVTEGTVVYEIVGRPDNILDRGDVEAVGLRKVG